MYRCENGHVFSKPETYIGPGRTEELGCPICKEGIAGSQITELKGEMKVPDNLKPHASDYKHGAWTKYTLEELGQWVALLAKRSSHRSNLDKRKKDLYDARNYLSMLDAQLSHLEDEFFETICVLDECVSPAAHTQPPDIEIGGVDLCGADK